MHFWIDKRSQCGYNGRNRIPSTLSAGVGRPRGRVSVGVNRKPLASTAHRFQPVDCVAPAPRRPRTQRNGSHTAPIHSTRRHASNNDSVYIDLTTPVAPPPSTIHALAAARSVTPDTLLRTAALGLQNDSSMIPQHLKCGMWASFALATMFVTGAKFYFDQQIVHGGGAMSAEVGVVCGFVLCICVILCAAPMCRARTQPPPPLPPERISSTALYRPPTDSTDDLSLGSLLQSERTDPSPTSSNSAEAPPPPYHIAVLYPPTSTTTNSGNTSTPPPDYSMVS